MQHHNHTNSNQTRRGLNRGTVAALLSTLGFFCAVTFFGIAHVMVPAPAPVAAVDVSDPLPELPALDIADDTESQPVTETAETEVETEPTEEPEVTTPRTNRGQPRGNTGRSVTTPTTPADDAPERNPGRLIINLDDDPMADVDTGGILDA